MRNNRFSILFSYSNHQSDRAMNDAKRQKSNNKRNVEKNNHVAVALAKNSLETSPLGDSSGNSLQKPVTGSSENSGSSGTAEHVVFLSIDYDDCGACLTKPETDPQKKAFLEHLRKDIADAKDVRLMIGSNRQNDEIDSNNDFKHDNGLVMVEFPKLAKKQEWTFDNFLIGYFDKLKVNLLKSQIEHVASTLKKGQYATIHFYDDCDDILRELIKNIEPKDMPENVRLNLTKVFAKSKSDKLEILDCITISRSNACLSAAYCELLEKEGRAAIESASSNTDFHRFLPGESPNSAVFRGGVAGATDFRGFFPENSVIARSLGGELVRATATDFRGFFPVESRNSAVSEATLDNDGGAPSRTNSPTNSGC